MVTARTILLSQVTERALQAQIVAEAKGWGWLTWHNTMAWRSGAGFLDVLMVRRGRLVIAELKTMRGKLTTDQRVWLMAWYQSGRCDGPYVWDPSYSHQVTRVLLPDNMAVLL